MEYDIDLHSNTIWLINWNDKMIAKYGHPETGYDWCRKLAYYMGEEGNDIPSPDAIAIAKKWLENGPSK